MAKKTETYSAKNITSLTPREHLIKRINLTFSHETGDENHPYSSQKTVAIREIIDNSVGELLRNFGDKVKVTFYKDSSVEVQDDGRGLPTDSALNAFKENVSGFIITLGTLQSGENLGENSSGGKSTSQNGLGASAAVALSSRVDISVFKNNKEYYLSFKDFEPGLFSDDETFTKLKDKSKVFERKDSRSKEEKQEFSKGTKIRLWLSQKHFKSKYPIDVEDLTNRMKLTSYLLPRKTFIVENLLNEEPVKQVFYSENGMGDLVKDNSNKELVSPIISFSTSELYKRKGEELSVETDFSFAWNKGYDSSVTSFVNTINTKLNGVHVNAFYKAVTQAFNEKIDKMKSIRTAKDPVPIEDDYKEGLVAVISVFVTEPEFTNQIKEALGGIEDGRALQKAYYKEISKWVNTNKNLAHVKVIGEKVVLAAKNRQKLNEEKQIIKDSKNLSKSSKMPSKLLDCEIHYDDNTELFIAEGDSALSGLKSARNSLFQALIPIRGKIINVSKQSVKKVLSNEEVISLIKTFGGTFGENFDISLSKYKRVILAVDADYDGGQIASLLILLFYKYFPTFIKEGRLFIINTPLFILKNKTKKKDVIYLFTNEEFENAQKTLDMKKYEVIRAKGLGETGDEALWETGMNPETRTLTKVVLTNPEEDNKWLEVAMGEEIEARKDWITENANWEIDD